MHSRGKKLQYFHSEADGGEILAITFDTYLNSMIERSVLEYKLID